MRGAVPALPPYVFTAWCLVKHGDYFYPKTVVIINFRHSVSWRLVFIYAERWKGGEAHDWRMCWRDSCVTAHTA